MCCDFQSVLLKGDGMHIDSASLLTNTALLAICILAVGFLLWFLVALTMEGNEKHVHCRMELRVDAATSDGMERVPLREVSALRPTLGDAYFVPQGFAVPGMLVTHRAVRAVALRPERGGADESWQGTVI